MSGPPSSDSERWRRIDELFAAALELRPDERAAYLDTACAGDAALRRELESLLASDRDDRFLADTLRDEAFRLLGSGDAASPVGRTLGRFRVLGELGAGGMGEVYLAFDPRLARRVALKIVPRGLADDPERAGRFRREALAVSALNHPNILTVHEIEVVDGADVMVTELVEGESLRDRLRRGPLPVAAALDLAVQLGRALAASHAIGVVHRDVKPENVMLRPDGLVKLVDFGIARALPASASSPALGESPTVVPTAAGVLLGTAPYMAPEQVRGQPAGRQADVWALGCLLYEALAGRQAFSGATVSDVLAAILTLEPDWNALPAETPAGARRALRHCLAKEPDGRFQDVADVRIELEEALREPVAPSGAGGRAGRARRALAVVGWAAAAATLAALLAWRLAPREASSPAASGRFELQPPPGVEIPRGNDASLALSPDGAQIAFVGADPSGARRLYVRAIDEVDARPMPGTEECTSPFFSPDGTWLGFHSRGAVRKVLVAGGASIPLAATPHLRGASWAEDGTIVFSDGDRLLRVSAAGGEPVVLLAAEADGTRYRWPLHLPGGRALLFLAYRGVREADHEIASLSLDSGERHVLVRGGSFPRHAMGHVVYSRLGALHAAPLARGALALESAPRPLRDKVSFFLGSSIADFDLSPSGALLYSPGFPLLRDGELVEVDRRGRAVPLASRRAAFFDAPSPSPDGERFAVVIRSSFEEADLWTFAPASGEWTRITTGAGAMSSPVWSRDGRWLYFSDVPAGIPRVFRVPTDASAPAEPLSPGSAWEYPTSIAPGGDVVVVERSQATGELDLAALDLGRKGALRTLVATPAREGEGELSPDGSWLAYTSDRDGEDQVYVRPLDLAGPARRVSTHGGSSPRWSARGQAIYFRCRDPRAAATQGICVAERTGAAGDFGPPRRVLELEASLAGRFAVSRDEESFYFLRRVPEATDRRRIVYVPGWSRELAKPPSPD